ncbi:CcdB family protein [Aliamphritea hakodatensis]|uniref:CcdB family protein n=1 Tax=Aliamphritea hakodatensis TaxID=2895352 RepID=UPI0022FD79F5|nr:CcdB family protein [Aliamphritea hakodatensis]
MAQFDVYLNPSEQSRKRFPFLVDVQSNVLNDLNTRIVIPMGYSEHFSEKPLNRLTPEITYEGISYLLLTPQLSSVSEKILRQPLGTLEHLRLEILAAVDFAISGI